MEYGVIYLDSKELRKLANACIEAADWLDLRYELSKD
jgi:hypothetical protein